MTEKVCRACGAALVRRDGERTGDWNSRTTCNAACGHKAGAQKRYGGIERQLRCCEKCNGVIKRRANESWPFYAKRRFCSPECQIAATCKKPREPSGSWRDCAPKVCPECNRQFRRQPGTSAAVWARTRYCGKSCSATARWSARKAVGSHNSKATAKAAPAEKLFKSGWQIASERQLAEKQAVAERLARERPAGPKFSTVEEFVAYHGTEKLRAGMPQYSAANDPMQGIPVHPMSLGGGRVGGGRR